MKIFVVHSAEEAKQKIADEREKGFLCVKATDAADGKTCSLTFVHKKFFKKRRPQ